MFFIKPTKIEHWESNCFVVLNAVFIQNPNTEHVMPPSRERVFITNGLPSGFLIGSDIMQFDRIKMIIDEEKISEIQNKNILIVGIGGVGGSALETLARFGVKNITIIDNDVIDITNLNRQIISLHSNIGRKKCDVAKERVQDIYPDIKVNSLDIFLDKDNLSNILDNNFDYIIDACDTITTKLEIIRWCQSNDINLITCLGTGNRFDPTKIEITTLNKTHSDPLAKILRKLVKDNNLNDKLKVVWSNEAPVKTKGRTPGSNAIVPNVAGIYLASYIINDILTK